MDTIFWMCVDLMKQGSAFLGITYQEFNVILFVFLHPLITFFFVFQYLKYRKRYRLQLRNLE